MKIVIIITIIIVVALIVYAISKSCGCTEDFGALQSLYSNDGIQDRYLTVENDPRYYDPYRYWRGVPWDIPTRNLNRITFYPYLYENYVDRYGIFYPYW